jgi:hypothetical protein
MIPHQSCLLRSSHDELPLHHHRVLLVLPLTMMLMVVVTMMVSYYHCLVMLLLQPSACNDSKSNKWILPFSYEQVVIESGLS